MQPDIQAELPHRRVDAVERSSLGPLSTALAWAGAAILLAAIAYTLGATLLT